MFLPPAFEELISGIFYFSYLLNFVNNLFNLIFCVYINITKYIISTLRLLLALEAHSFP